MPPSQTSQISKLSKLTRLLSTNPFQKYIYELIEHPIFTGFIIFVILLNTIVLIVQTDEEISVRSGWYFSALDNVFLAIYIMEMVLKLYALRWSYFKTGWNVMDSVIVVFTTLDFLLPLIVVNAGQFDVAAIFRLLKMFRSIKALRALRVLRTIRFLKNLQVIMTTILKSFRALSTIVLLQSLFLYMFAVIGRGLFHEVDPQRFGSLTRAFLTLFQLITLDDWYYMYTDVTNVDPSFSFIIVYLIIYIVLENFIFLNLFVAVLVDNFQRTLTAAEEQRKEKRERKHRSVFILDEDDREAGDDDSVDGSEQDKVDEDEASESQTTSYCLKATIEDFYSPDDYPETRDRVLLSDYFQNLATLETNIHQMKIQQRLLDDLLDITVTIPDVPEELI